MKHLVQALHGALFAVAFAVLMFFLKIICPINVGCLADPFLVILFWPLRLFHMVGIDPGYSQEPIAILIFWFIIGFVVGIFWPTKKPGQKLNDAELSETKGEV